MSIALAAGLALSSFVDERCFAAGASASELVASCAACHRLDNTPNGIPPIVGLGREQIVDMMVAFKARTQSSPIMHVVARSLSADQIAAIADYLEALTKAKGP